LLLLRHRKRRRICLVLVRLQALHSLKVLPGVAFFGLKGAALAAFGESPLDFCPELLTERDEGVKLGESTLSFFLALLHCSAMLVVAKK